MTKEVKKGKGGARVGSGAKKKIKGPKPLTSKQLEEYIPDAAKLYKLVMYRLTSYLECSELTVRETVDVLRIAKDYLNGVESGFSVPSIIIKHITEQAQQRLKPAEPAQSKDVDK